MRNILIITILAILFLYSCDSNQQSKSEDTAKNSIPYQSKMDIEAIKKQLILQQGMDTPDYPGIKRYYLAAKDIDLLVQVIHEGLTNAGYVFPNRKEFDQRIQDIYHIGNPKKKSWLGPALSVPVTAESWKSGENFITSYEEYSDQTEDNWYQMIAFDQYNFVFGITPLRKLIAFDKNGNYKITLPAYLVARNNYLFHQDHAALKYLIQKDKEFVASLVVAFSYDSEPEFNGLILNKYTTGTIEDEGIGNAIFNFDIPDKLIIKKGLLKYVEDHTNQNNNEMYMGLNNFIFHISDNKNFPGVTFTNKCKMLAYVGTLGEQLQNKYMGKNPNKWPINTLLTNFKIHYPKFIDEIKKQNYFDEPEIKAAVASAEQAAYVAGLHSD